MKYHFLIEQFDSICRFVRNSEAASSEQTAIINNMNQTETDTSHLSKSECTQTNRNRRSNKTTHMLQYHQDRWRFLLRTYRINKWSALTVEQWSMENRPSSTCFHRREKPIKREQNRRRRFFLTIDIDVQFDVNIVTHQNVKRNLVIRSEKFD